jgi:chromosome segregation ATPase
MLNKSDININMINNIKELIKNKENQDVLGKLDHDLINTFKGKIANLVGENNKLSEEVSSITRNFEALCLKSKEDTNFIKKLESKIKSLEQGAEDKNQVEIMNSYKGKINELNAIIKDLEAKLNNNNSISSKNQEKENFYRNFITKLEDKVKGLGLQNETIVKENNKLKSELKVSESRGEDTRNKERNRLDDLQAEFDKVKKEYELSTKLLFEYRERNKVVETDKESLEKQLQEEKEKLTALQNDSFKNESGYRKTLFEVNGKLRVVSEERDKLAKLVQRQNEEIGSIREENNLEKAYGRFNLEIDKLTNKINELTDQNDLLTSQNIGLLKDMESLAEQKNNAISKLNSDVVSLNSVIDGLKDEKNILLKDNSNKEKQYKDIIESNKSNEKVDKLNSDINTLVFAKALAENKIKEQELCITDLANEVKSLSEQLRQSEKNSVKSLNTLRQGVEDMLTKFSQSFTQILVNNIFPVNDKVTGLADRVYKLKAIVLGKQLELKDRKAIIVNNLQTKLGEAKAFKDEKNELLTKIYKLGRETEESNKGYSKIKEEYAKHKEGVAKFLQQVVNSNLKLKLSIETLFLLTKCRGCSGDSNKSFILQCGHSTCEGCSKGGKCIECDKITKPLLENLSVNNLFARIKFINQLINDIDTINSSIKEYI